jgi:hypothetical protein
MKEEWDYCQINMQILDDGRDPGRGGNKLMWLQFFAQASGPHRSYTAGKSTRIPVASIPGATYAPQQGNDGHRAILQNLLDALEVDDWEQTAYKGGPWWEVRLRRPARPKHSLKSRGLRGLQRIKSCKIRAIRGYLQERN